MLNGPTYEFLVKYFSVRAKIYCKHASKLEEDEKVLIEPSLKGKTREEMDWRNLPGQRFAPT